MAAQPNAKRISVPSTPERWAQIEELFHRAIECAPELRASLLDEACRDDLELRRDVESLLSSDARAGRCVQSAVRSELGAFSFPLAGETISHYRILDGLAGGGMGLVYRAEDLKLGRRVALKFLPEESAKDPVALKRFEREARSASALEHPNICPIYEFGEHEGQPFLVMPLLDGRTLRELIAAAGPGKLVLELNTLLDLGIQIADGLEAAHRQGIIHRDIKPENIAVTTKGQAKILDFGLAKLTQSVTAGGDDSERGGSDVDAHGTAQVAAPPAVPDLFLSRAGVAMGTAGYMSPEQVRGEQLDARTDLFSFGLVLYEMATGRRAYSGDTGPTLQEAIFEQMPARARKVNPQLPAKLETIINKALEKDLAARYQSAADMRVDLERLKKELQPDRRTRRLIAFAIAGALLILTILAEAAFRTPPVPHVTRITQITESGNMDAWATPVTDGSRVYFLERQGNHWNAMQAPVNGGPVQPVFASLPNARILDISPDKSRFLIGRFLQRNEMTIWTIPVQGGTPERVGDLAAQYAIFAPGGKQILFAKGSDLMICDSDGQHARKIASVRGTVDRPAWSPDGKAVRFYVRDELIQSGQLWEIAADGTNLHAVFPDFRVTRSSGVCCGHWTPDGRYFFFELWRESKANLWALREKRGVFDWKKPKPVQLTDGPGDFTDPVPSWDGRKVFLYQINPDHLAWRYDPRLHSMKPIPGSTRRVPHGDPLGEWIIYEERGMLWRSRSDGSELVQLTHAPLLGTVSVQWSLDGAQVLLAGMDAQEHGQILALDRASWEPKLLYSLPAHIGNVAWCPDSKSVILALTPRETGTTSLQLLELATHRLQKLPGSDGMESGVCSPDGRFVLGVTDDYNKLKLYETRSQKWTELVSGNLLTAARWAPDSQSLYYQDLLAENEPVYRFWLKSGRRQTVFDFHELFTQGYFQGRLYSLEPDGTLLFRMVRRGADLYALDVDLP